jgi:hypothetical protein
MKYGVYFGIPPYNHCLGVVEGELNQEPATLQKAINTFKGVIPEGVDFGREPEEVSKWAQHPVIGEIMQ